MQATFDPAVERAFVQAVLATDERSIDQFARRIAFALRFVGSINAKRGRPLSEDEVEEVAAECCATAWRRLADYEPIAPLEHWIAGICELSWKDAVRNKFRNQRPSVDLDGLPAPDGGQPLGRVLDLAEIEGLLAGIGGMEARVLRLKHLEGLKFHELAARLGISTNTAKSWYYRARKRLQRERGAEGEQR